MDPSTEIRKLSPSNVAKLFNILEDNESWKILMANIPTRLDKNKPECPITAHNLPKYHTEHFRLIENASTKIRTCSEILFDEWGTSGRVRPAVGHLLYLLTHAKLYRAADYVSKDLLHQDGVERPTGGPAEKVDTSLTTDNIDTNEINQRLDRIAYPSSIISELAQKTERDDNLDVQPTARRAAPKIPMIVISDTAKEAKLMVMPRSRDVARVARPRSSSQSSDMIQFSTVYSTTSNNSAASQNEFDTKTDNDTNCTESSVNSTSDYASSRCDADDAVPDEPIPSLDNIPMLTMLRNNADCQSPATNSFVRSATDTPNLSAFDRSVDNYIPAISALHNADERNASPSSTERAVRFNTTSESIETINSTQDINEDNPSTFDTNSVEFIPNISLLHNASPDDDAYSSDNIPRFSVLQSMDNPAFNTTNASISSIDSTDLNNVPQIRALINPAVAGNLQINITDCNGNQNLPLQCDNIGLSPTSDNASAPIIIESDFSSNASSNPRNTTNLPLINSRQSCVSPLPTLSLNTLLPHFNYYELENRTNCFDMVVHRSGVLLENRNSDEPNGRFLGSGAFGTVFLAIGLLDRPVAVKKLNLDNFNVVKVDDTVTKQFRTEVEVLSKFKHENLLSLVGYSCDGPTYCLLYEYISGGALNERLKFGDNLKWRTRMDIAMGTARAASYLHTAQSTPLIHRDIKTANILLDCSNRAKLCDFGLIKLSSGTNTSTCTTAIGTSAYMAPEAFRGDVSVKIDTYSFGVVLLELLTGLPALDESRDGCDLVTFIQSTNNNNIEPLLDTKSGAWIEDDINFGIKLFEIANRCLISEKIQRPTTVEITSQLNNLLHDFRC